MFLPPPCGLSFSLPNSRGQCSTRYLCQERSFLSSQMDGAAAVLSAGRGGEKEDKERDKEKRSVCVLCVCGGVTALHNTTVYERVERKPVAFSPCFTSQLCLDKPHSTCVITTDTGYFFQTQVQASTG